MAVTANSDMLINSYYGSYRGSFYAADSGLNIARTGVVSQITSAVSTTACPGWETGSPPTGCTSAPMNTSNAIGNAFTSNYQSYTSLNAGQAANSWPGSFVIANLTGCTNQVQLVSGGATHQNASGQNDTYVYTYSYEVCSAGRAQALQQVNTKEDGNVIVTIQAQGAPGGHRNVSFSSFGAFIDNFSPCSAPLVQGTMTGPFFTNGAWNFGTGSTGYNFTNPVGQAGAQASYWINGTCYQSAQPSYTQGSQTVKPTFQQGFNPGADAVTLPANDFVQQWAVIDGVGCGEGGTTCGVSAPPYPTNSNLNAALRNINGTQYPLTGTTTGVYLPYCTIGPGCTSPNTITGGGFYVEGDASIQLSLGNDALGNPTQTYTITQPNSGGTGGHRGGSHSGSGNTTTTITLNINANITTVVSGSTTLNLIGVPENKAGSSPQEGAMLYVDGTITGLSGPSGQSNENVASIQDYYATTVSAANDIDITGNLIYKHEPVTLNTSDTLVAGNDYNQVLGIFTTNGNVVLSSPYTDKNLEVDASIAMINACSSNGGTCPNGSSSYGLATSGSINTWTVVGGRIESYAHGVSITKGNTWFDQRFLSKQGFAPPWFPSTTVDAADLSNASAPKVIPTIQRTTWVTWPQ
jgi:hypothetical protein